MLLLSRNALNGDLQTNYVVSRNATGPSEQWAACLSGQFTQSDDFKVKHFGIMWMSSNLFKKECMEMHTVKNNAISWWWLTNTCSKIPKNEEGSLCSNEITLSYMVVVVFLV